MSEEYYLRAVVVAFHPDRGFGFLRLLRDPTDRSSATKDMPSYFFHFKMCGLPKEALHPGLIVDFELASRNGSGNELNPPRENLQAINFTPIEEIFIPSED
jgi:hypothetical protein